MSKRVPQVPRTRVGIVKRTRFHGSAAEMPDIGYLMTHILLLLEHVQVEKLFLQEVCSWFLYWFWQRETYRQHIMHYCGEEYTDVKPRGHREKQCNMVTRERHSRESTASSMASWVKKSMQLASRKTRGYTTSHPITKPSGSEIARVTNLVF